MSQELKPLDAVKVLEQSLAGSDFDGFVLILRQPHRCGPIYMLHTTQNFNHHAVNQALSTGIYMNFSDHNRQVAEGAAGQELKEAHDFIHSLNTGDTNHDPH